MQCAHVPARYQTSGGVAVAVNTLEYRTYWTARVAVDSLNPISTAGRCCTWLANASTSGVRRD